MFSHPSNNNVGGYFPRIRTVECIYGEHTTPPKSHTVYLLQLFVRVVHTTVTSSPVLVESWLQTILQFHRNRLHKLVVGMGVQWTRHPATRNRQAATLQLCVGSHCLIIQLIHLGRAPDLLRDFLRDPRYTFVGVWNKIDRHLLWRTNHRLEVRRVVDLRLVALGQGRCSSDMIEMQRLAEVVLGFEFGDENETKPLEVTVSNWDADRLSLEQVQYACIDAFVSFLIGLELRVWDRG